MKHWLFPSASISSIFLQIHPHRLTTAPAVQQIGVRATEPARAKGKWGIVRKVSGTLGGVLCCTRLVEANQVIGKTQHVIGSATVIRADGTTLRLAVADTFCQGDVIETEVDGRVGITFEDGTAVTLSPNTRVALDELHPVTRGRSGCHRAPGCIPPGPGLE
jgi:hypothetical protein